MTKNTDSESYRTVRVFDADGTEIGSTYPKRAAGLIKKGRAQYVNDFDIRLTASDVSDNTEDKKMDNNITVSENTAIDNRLYFDPRKWFSIADPTNSSYKSVMTAPDGSLSDAYMLGSWHGEWFEIGSEELTLSKNTEYKFTFWLNGGENDRFDETCQLAVLFDGDYDNRLIYNLNRNYIAPLKRVNGWELYEIPFKTEENELTQLRFMACGAIMTVMTAKDPSEYKDLADTADEFEGRRPQRHNIVFNDGWPINTWYSTNVLKGDPIPNQRVFNGDLDPDDLEDFLNLKPWNRT